MIDKTESYKIGAIGLSSKRCEKIFEKVDHTDTFRRKKTLVSVMVGRTRRLKRVVQINSNQIITVQIVYKE